MRLYICMYCSHDVGLMLRVHACLHVLFLLQFFHVAELHQLLAVLSIV
jgi:hypothetical protein